MDYPFKRDLEMLEHGAARGPIPAFGRTEEDDLGLAFELCNSGLFTCTNPQQI